MDKYIAKKKHLIFQWHEFKRALRTVYKWNRNENKYIYFCTCSNVWYRSGNIPAVECKFCHKQPRKIKKTSFFQAISRAIKTARLEFKRK